MRVVVRHFRLRLMDNAGMESYVQIISVCRLSFMCFRKIEYVLTPTAPLVLISSGVSTLTSDMMVV